MSDALIYPGCLNAFSAEPAQGKTMIALWAAAQLLEIDERVLYLDYEGNRRSVGGRLRSLGVKPEQAGPEQFLYVRPNIIGPAEKAALCDIVRQHEPRLVVVDGVAKSIARHGLNEDKAPDCLQWMERVCWPLSELGPGVLMLDHVSKSKDEQGRWARGSGAKLGELDGASYGLRGKFSRTKAGTVRMFLTKDREGWVGTEGETVALVHFTPEDNGERLGVRIERPASGGGDAFVPTECMGKIEAYLRSHPGQFFSQETIVEGVKPMRKATAIAAIAELVSSGTVHIDTEQRWPRYGVPSHLAVVPDPLDEEF